MSKKSGFTLVEMLVVIGIIVVLVALLVPMAAKAVSTTRNFNMAAEVSQLATAIERYKNEKGDYPPGVQERDVRDLDMDGDRDELIYIDNRYASVVERHLRKCYPKIDRSQGGEVDNFYANILPNLSPDESLVFWLSLTQNDERRPFTSQSKNYKQYYNFKQERLIDFDSDGFPSYKPNYAGETPFVYFDSRTYLSHGKAQFSVGGAQPYCDDNAKHMNPTTFQIVSAGQDREFGEAADQFDLVTGSAMLPKRFKSGVNYTDEDKDNLVSFAEGRKLADHIP